MPTINYSVTQSIDTLAVNLSASEALVMNINNPLVGASYFGLETIPNSDGIYTSASPKNTSGSFTMGAGILGVVKDDYKMSAVVSPGDNVLTFVPALAVTGSTLRTRGIASPPISGFDADALAFFTRVATAGGTLSTTEQTAVNQLVIDMKSANIWDAMKAIYPMVGASAAACAQNLKSSSFTGTFTSGWTFASTGVTPNGTSAYMNTNCAPTNMAQNSASGFIYNRTDSTLITLNGCTNFEINDFDPNRILYGAVNNAEQPIGTQTTTLGFWGVSRISSTGWANYKNGTNIANKTAASIAPSSLSIFMASRNVTGSPLTFGDKQVAFYCIGDGLTDTQASDFYTAVQTFQTTLSRQV